LSAAVAAKNAGNRLMSALQRPTQTARQRDLPAVAIALRQFLRPGIDHDRQRNITSFNVRGEPIVCTPEDAFRCFMGNELDLLVIGHCVLHKAEQKPDLRIDYSGSLDPD
jgi:hypothetical protein